MDDVSLVRQLAALMGWTIYDDHGEWVHAVNHDKGKGTCHIDRRGRVHITDDAAIAVRLWRPLHSMDDAWMVVERMQSLGWDYEAGSCFGGGRHYSTFGRGGFDSTTHHWDEQYTAQHSVPARAICEAVLLVQSPPPGVEV